MKLEQMICPNCQSNNFENKNDLYVCKYCLSTFSKSQMNSKMFVDLSLANIERNSGNFDKAKTLYSKIIEEFPNEDLTDVYWGLFLCEQRVIFEEDGKGEKFPSFYRINENESVNVEDSLMFNKTLVYAMKHNAQRIDIFNNLAQKIESARKMYLNIKKSTEPFDIFICFKNTDYQGAYTKDREIAMDIYNEFSSKYNIFFSEKTLKNIKSYYREYEPNIYYGLYTAKVMLLICSKKEYLESQWLKNEWSRFTQINSQGEDGKCIIPIFIDDFDVNDLPNELWHNQGIFDDRKLMKTLEDTLENLIHPIDKLQTLKDEQDEQFKKIENLIKSQEETEEEKQERRNKLRENAQAQRTLRFERIEKAVKRIENLEGENLPIMSFDEGYRQTVFFGRYPQHKVDKFEPIEWKIIDAGDDYIKLITCKVIDCCAFDKNESIFLMSDVKQFLDDIYKVAFTDEEKKLILPYKYDEDFFFEDTLNKQYKISLLTKEEAEIIGPPGCQKSATKYAIKNGLKVSKEKGWKKGASYWLMKPNSQIYNTTYAPIVAVYGVTSEDRVRNKQGVAPVIHLKI